MVDFESHDCQSKQSIRFAIRIACSTPNSISMWKAVNRFSFMRKHLHLNPWARFQMGGLWARVALPWWRVGGGRPNGAEAVWLHARFARAGPLRKSVGPATAGHAKIGPLASSLGTSTGTRYQVTCASSVARRTSVPQRHVSLKTTGRRRMVRCPRRRGVGITPVRPA